MDEVKIISIAVAIAPYRKLLEQLVNGEVAPAEFEGAYLTAQRTTRWMWMAPDVEEVVTDFFHAVDDYSEDPSVPGPEFGDVHAIGGEELIDAARELLRRVENEPDPDRARYRTRRRHST